MAMERESIYTNPADIEERVRENAARHKAELNKRPESTPGRQQCARQLFEMSTRIFERLRELKETGRLTLGSTDGEEQSVKTNFDEDEEATIFKFISKEPGALTIKRILRYLEKEKKGEISTYEALPAGFNHDIRSIKFWTDDEPTATGSHQSTNAQGPHEEDMLTEEELAKEVSVVIEQFEEAISRLETK